MLTVFARVVVALSRLSSPLALSGAVGAMAGAGLDSVVLIACSGGAIGFAALVNLFVPWARTRRANN